MTFEEHWEELESQSYTIFPAFRDKETTAALRTLMDKISGPVVQPDEPADVRRVRDMRHPMEGEILIEVANDSKTIDLAARLVGSRADAPRQVKASDLRMREQVLHRTDRAPSGNSGPTGWHVDFPFTQNDYEAAPRQICFQMVTYCNDVKPGAGSLMIVPGSHQLVYDALGDASVEDRKEFMKNPITRSGIDTDQGLEIPGEEGDLIVFSPSAAHSASWNTSDSSRYVYFTSYYPASATWLVNHLFESEYRHRFPDSLKIGMRPENQALLNVDSAPATQMK